MINYICHFPLEPASVSTAVTSTSHPVQTDILQWLRDEKVTSANQRLRAYTSLQRSCVSWLCFLLAQMTLNPSPVTYLHGRVAPMACRAGEGVVTHEVMGRNTKHKHCQNRTPRHVSCIQTSKHSYLNNYLQLTY